MNQATPEQQADYQKFVENGMELVYADKGLKALVTSMDGNGAPVDGLANTMAAVTMRLTDSAKKAGKPVSPLVALYGAGELLEQLAAFSEDSGGHSYTDDELKQVAQMMVDGLKKGAQPQGPPQGPPAEAAPPAGPAMPELMTGV